MSKKFECNPTGSCWCMDIPYKIEIGGDECLEPVDLINEIKDGCPELSDTIDTLKYNIQ